MSSIITVENISKKYIIGHQKQERYTALRDVLSNGAKHLAHKLRHPFSAPPPDPEHEEFWALKDVSFDIKQGDRVGIIGRNGAGKSTLLKILSRITEPTSGKISIKGRVASLLEVGTGFHPELTGRENIFLNGAILGMSKVEIKRKFDEIVAFSEVEKFLDTPVKRYSSGMYVRLAFAVAANLESDLLMVDEVLAVGDAAFQQKCLGKMEDVSAAGKTVLFVSHQIGVISQLCTTGLFFTKGELTYQGDVKNAISLYLGDAKNGDDATYLSAETRNIDADIRINKIKVCDLNGKVSCELDHNSSIKLVIETSLRKVNEEAVIGIAVKDQIGRIVFSNYTKLDRFASNICGELLAEVTIPGFFLTPGLYVVSVAIHVPNAVVIDLLGDCVRFRIIDAGSEFAIYEGKDYGCVFANCDWTLDLKK